MRHQTFGNFEVRNGNRFAHAAALAVSESPVKAYTPLFLYGGPGMGKTHLMRAIGRAVSEKEPKAKILYISCGELKDEMPGPGPDEVSDRDVLMMDDIHLIAGREKETEALSRVCRAFYARGGRIVISADRPPKEIRGVGEEFRAMFELGLIADIRGEG